MRIGAVLVIIWLLIGAVAAGAAQLLLWINRNCAKVGTIVGTIVAGRLNYLGVNPKIKCQLPTTFAQFVTAAVPGLATRHQRHEGKSAGPSPLKRSSRRSTWPDGCVTLNG